MPLVVTYLETERGEKAGTYDLMRTLECIGYNFKGGHKYLEFCDIWETKDRLMAAIVNLGFACRWYADNELTRGIIELKSDSDGKDYRYQKEHEVLFDLIYPRDGWRVKKNISLYGEYRKYLHRIKDLMTKQRLRIDYENRTGINAN